MDTVDKCGQCGLRGHEWTSWTGLRLRVWMIPDYEKHGGRDAAVPRLYRQRTVLRDIGDALYSSTLQPRAESASIQRGSTVLLACRWFHPKWFQRKSSFTSSGSSPSHSGTS